MSNNKNNKFVKPNQDYMPDGDIGVCASYAEGYMKKSLIFVIIILLISLVAFPVIFAEGGTSYLIDTKNVDTEVLSNMDNYMKLNSPVAIDKTADYLAVANNREIFIQPQNSKKNAYLFFFVILIIFWYSALVYGFSVLSTASITTKFVMFSLVVRAIILSPKTISFSISLSIVL